MAVRVLYTAVVMWGWRPMVGERGRLDAPASRPVGGVAVGAGVGSGPPSERVARVKPEGVCEMEGMDGFRVRLTVAGLDQHRESKIPLHC
jgi:hypothetical protein